MIEFEERKNCLWTAVQLETHELCGDGKKINTNYSLKPYSWWWCCKKMEKEMYESVFWDDKRAHVYIDKPSGYEEFEEIQIDNCPFCGKEIKIEQTERLTFWKKIVEDRYGKLL